MKTKTYILTFFIFFSGVVLSCSSTSNIQNKDEKTLKVNITKINLLTSDTITYIREIKDSENKISNNVEIISNEYLPLYKKDLLFMFNNEICCRACDQPRALKPEYIKIHRNDKGNIIGISGCGIDTIVMSCKYDTSDKLSEIKTEEHLYKIEWL